MTSTAEHHQTILYPEHTKLKACRDQSQMLGSFIEWLRERAGSDETATADWLFGGRLESILAEYLEIDERKLEAEKVAMLDAQRRLNEERAP